LKQPEREAIGEFELEFISYYPLKQGLKLKWK